MTSGDIWADWPAEIASRGRTIASVLRSDADAGGVSPRLTRRQAVRIALRAGLSERDANVWANSAVTVHAWPIEVFELVPELSGLMALDRFALRCQIATGSATTAPVPRTKRPGISQPRVLRAEPRRRGSRKAQKARGATVLVKVQVLDKPVAPVIRLKGALAPARGLRTGSRDEAAFPGRPRGWSTTDWLSSKS